MAPSRCFHIKGGANLRLVTNKFWNEQRIAELWALVTSGADCPSIAAHFQKSEDAIRHVMMRHNMAFGRSGRRSQPRAERSRAMPDASRERYDRWLSPILGDLRARARSLVSIPQQADVLLASALEMLWHDFSRVPDRESFVKLAFYLVHRERCILGAERETPVEAEALEELIDTRRDDSPQLEVYWAEVHRISWRYNPPTWGVVLA